MTLPALVSLSGSLYLATVVEKTAHRKLYDHFPHLYFEIAEDSLPNCVRDREVLRRLSNGGRNSRKNGGSMTAEADADWAAKFEPRFD